MSVSVGHGGLHARSAGALTGHVTDADVVWLLWPAISGTASIDHL